MIAKIDKEQHAGDYQHMASYLEAVLAHRYTQDPSTPEPIVLDSEEVRNFAWIASQIRSIEP